eukprot:UN28508
MLVFFARRSMKRKVHHRNKIFKRELSERISFIFNIV